MLLLGDRVRFLQRMPAARDVTRVFLAMFSMRRLLGLFFCLTVVSLLISLSFYIGETAVIHYVVQKNQVHQIQNRQAKTVGKPEGIFDSIISAFDSWLGEPIETANAISRSFTKTDLEQMSEIFQQTHVDCSAIFSGNEKAITRATAFSKLLALQEAELYQEKSVFKIANETLVRELETQGHNWTQEFPRLSNQWYINATRDCANFKRSRGYITSSLTQEEEDFPIAFSIMVFKEVEMFERLLRAVYRPQNRYCIHVDVKSKPEFLRAVQGIASCFPESVRLASRQVDVRWGKFTVLEPELICLEDLWAGSDSDYAVDQSYNNSTSQTTGQQEPSMASSSVPEGLSTMPSIDTDVNDTSSSRPEKDDAGWRTMWKYFINLTGQEFALKTNYELVQILKSLKGANNEEGTIKRVNKERWKTPPPHGFVPVKGGVHTLLNRATADFILHDQRVHDLVEWLKTTKVPDETFFATINYNPQFNVPGTYNGSNLEVVPYLTRYKEWRWGKHCASKHLVHDLCIFSTADLPLMGSAYNLFANKFYLSQDRVAIGCLEEKHFNATRDEFLGHKTFNTSFYENQDFVLSRVRGKYY